MTCTIVTFALLHFLTTIVKCDYFGMLPSICSGTKVGTNFLISELIFFY